MDTKLAPDSVIPFVFDLWLGSYASRHKVEFERWSAKVKTTWLAALIPITGLVALGETRLLTHLHSPDPLNTLRISNQILSLLIVLLIFKSQKTISPAFALTCLARFAKSSLRVTTLRQMEQAS